MAAWNAAPPVVLVNGQRAAHSLVSMQAADPSLWAGLGAFETLAVYDGNVVAFDAHLARLFQSARLLGWSAAPEPTWRDMVEAAVQAWDQPKGALRLLSGPSGLAVVTLGPHPPPRLSARVVSVTWPSPPFPPATAKHTSRAGASLACSHYGCDEVVRCSAAGTVLEGTWSNVFSWDGAVLRTAPDDGEILAGITRAQLLEIAVQNGLLVVQESPLPNPTHSWFITSSLQGVVPLTHWNHLPLPPVPAALRELQSALDALVGRSTRRAASTE